MARCEQQDTKADNRPARRKKKEENQIILKGIFLFYLETRTRGYDNRVTFVNHNCL